MRRVAAVAGLAFAGVLAGCGGSSTPTASTSTSTGSTTAPASSASTPASSSATANGGVAIIGDSLTYQAGNGQKAMTQVLEAHGWAKNQICWSGVDGRTIVDTVPGGAASTQQEVARCKKQVNPSVWIIALITNDLGNPPAQISKDMQTVLAAIGPSAKVVWVNAGRQDLGTQTVLDDNPVVAKVVAGRPNTKLADWFGYLKAHPKQQGWWVADGTHMTPKGYLQRNTFIADQARQFAG